MPNIQQNLLQIRKEIAQITQKFGRSTDAVTLVAVSKTKPIELIAEAFKYGQRHFAENYVLEGVEKILKWNPESDNQLDSIIWHYIGQIQSNKCAAIAQNFDWVHSLASIKHAKRLNKFRPETLAPLNICIQVQIQPETQRNGLLLDQVNDFLQHLDKLQNLNVRGLMCVLPEGWLDDKADYGFELVQKKFTELQRQYSGLDTLSMGMSGDYANAIHAGATMLRIGSAIFGKRH